VREEGVQEGVREGIGEEEKKTGMGWRNLTKEFRKELGKEFRK
jgi:hypothetical protein